MIKNNGPGGCCCEVPSGLYTFYGDARGYRPGTAIGTGPYIQDGYNNFLWLDTSLQKESVCHQVPDCQSFHNKVDKVAMSVDRDALLENVGRLIGTFRDFNSATNDQTYWLRDENIDHPEDNPTGNLINRIGGGQGRFLSDFNWLGLGFHSEFAIPQFYNEIFDENGIEGMRLNWLPSNHPDDPGAGNPGPVVPYTWPDVKIEHWGFWMGVDGFDHDERPYHVFTMMAAPGDADTIWLQTPDLPQHFLHNTWIDFRDQTVQGFVAGSPLTDVPVLFVETPIPVDWEDLSKGYWVLFQVTFIYDLSSPNIGSDGLQIRIVDRLGDQEYGNQNYQDAHEHDVMYFKEFRYIAKETNFKGPDVCYSDLAGDTPQEVYQTSNTEVHTPERSDTYTFATPSGSNSYPSQWEYDPLDANGQPKVGVTWTRDLDHPLAKVLEVNEHDIIKTVTDFSFQGIVDLHSRNFVGLGNTAVQGPSTQAGSLPFTAGGPMLNREGSFCAVGKNGLGFIKMGNLVANAQDTRTPKIGTLVDTLELIDPEDPYSDTKLQIEIDPFVSFYYPSGSGHGTTVKKGIPIPFELLEYPHLHWAGPNNGLSADNQNGGQIVKTPSFSDPKPAFHDGYAYWSQEYTKYPRFLGLASHGFPKCFGVIPPEMEINAPPNSPFGSLSSGNWGSFGFDEDGDPIVDRVIYNNWKVVKDVTQEVKFTFGDIQEYPITIIEAITDNQAREPSIGDSYVVTAFTTRARYFATTAIGASNTVAWTWSHETKRVFQYNFSPPWSGPGHPNDRYAYCGPGESLYTLRDLHCWGEMVYADGNDNNHIFSCVVSKCDYSVDRFHNEDPENPQPAPQVWKQDTNVTGLPVDQSTGKTYTWNDGSGAWNPNNNDGLYRNSDPSTGIPRNWDEEPIESVVEGSHEHYLKVIVNGNVKYSQRVYHAGQSSDVVGLCMGHNNDWYFFQRLYDPNDMPSETNDGTPVGWCLHTNQTASNAPIFSEPHGVHHAQVPSVVAANEDYFIAVNFPMSDQLTVGGGFTDPDVNDDPEDPSSYSEGLFPDAWMIRNSGSSHERQIPYHKLHVGAEGFDYTDEDTWPFRDRISSGPGGDAAEGSGDFRTDMLNNFNKFDFAPNDLDFGIKGNTSTNLGKKFPARVPLDGSLFDGVPSLYDSQNHRV